MSKDKKHAKSVIVAVVAADLNHKPQPRTNPGDPDNVMDWIVQEKAKDKSKIEKISNEDLIKSIESGEKLVARLLKNLFKLYQYYIREKGKIKNEFREEILKYYSLDDKFKTLIVNFLLANTNIEIAAKYTLNDLFPHNNSAIIKLSTSEIERHNILTKKIKRDIDSICEIKF